jgi:hypothetical protein
VEGGGWRVEGRREEGGRWKVEGGRWEASCNCCFLQPLTFNPRPFFSGVFKEKRDKSDGILFFLNCILRVIKK